MAELQGFSPQGLGEMGDSSLQRELCGSGGYEPLVLKYIYMATLALDSGEIMKAWMTDGMTKNYMILMCSEYLYFRKYPWKLAI